MNICLLKQIFNHCTNRLSAKSESLGLTAESKADFSLRLTRRETYADVPDECIGLAVGNADLKPYPRLKKLSFPIFFE